jgi:flavin-dependent dehydrogenase
MFEYDVIVIGAGPAGSTVSTLLAQKGHRVLLLEKSHFPREKLCGEFITPECLNVFDRLDIRERIYDAGAQLIAKWTFFAPDGRSVEMPIEWIAEGYHNAISISRARMDFILLERAREVGVEVREGIHVSPRFNREGNLGIIEGKADGEKVEYFSAPIVIDSSGRNGAFSNQIRQYIFRFRGSRMFGCKVYLNGIEDLREGGELFFFHDGYGGLSRVEGDRTNLCFMTTEATLLDAKGDRERLLDLTMRTNPAALRRLQDTVIKSDWLGTGPINYGRNRSLPGLLAIGDAGAFIDPFTGSGILLALKSGELAAKVINQSFTNGVRNIETVKKSYNKLHREIFGLRFRASALLRSLAFRPLTRNMLATVLTHHQYLLKPIALSTRQRWQSIKV